MDEADGITDPGRVYAWIRTAAHRWLNREANHKVRELVVDPIAGGLDENASEDPTPEEALIAQENEGDMATLVQEVASTLPERRRRVLALYGAGLKRSEIASRLGLTERLWSDRKFRPRPGHREAPTSQRRLDMRQLDPSELRPGLENPLTVRKLADPEIKVVVNGSLALELIRRSGLRREESEWVSPDGRRTAAIAEAVLWALMRIATGRSKDAGRLSFQMTSGVANVWQGCAMYLAWEVVGLLAGTAAGLKAAARGGPAAAVLLPFASTGA